jgi:hypothetical protein
MLYRRAVLFTIVLAFGVFATNVFATVSVAVSPGRAPVTLKQTQQFRATVSGTTNLSVTWLVDGIAGGNSLIGTITSSGLYTPPSVAGTHTVTARSNADTTKSASATIWVTNYPGMYTFHADRYRSGLNSQERALAPGTVNVNTFGKLFTRAVDGQIYAQLLHVANLYISGGYHNVVYVATEHDSVYAFDADGKTSSYLWKRSFINPTAGINTIAKPSNALIAPEIGITSTPVIDRGSNTIYVLASTNENGTIVHRLHALSLTSGTEKFGGPVAISGSAGGATFQASRHLQRPALLLLSGVVYIAFGSNGDALPYYGWLFAYTANGTGTLHRVAIHCTSPARQASAIWQVSGPAADNSGYIYLTTGNGAFDLNTGGPDEGDSFLKLSASTLARVDYFTPFDQSTLMTNDWDLGSSGIMIPPTQSGAVHPYLVIAGGKEGIMYVVDRTNMGKFNSTTDNVVQKILLGAPEPVNGNSFAPANWNGFVYFGAVNDHLRAYRFQSGLLTASPTSQSNATYAYPGTSPTVSANGTTNGVGWVLDDSSYAGGTPTGAVNTQGPAILHAYNASNLGQELYNSAQASNGRDTAGIAIKFTTPTVANGRVYVGGAKQLTVYGPLP